MTYIETEAALNTLHILHSLLIYSFLLSSAALKATQYSDTDLWDLHKKITKFNKVIDLIMKGKTKSGNLNKTAEVKLTEITI